MPAVWKSPKMGKNYTIPLPGPTPENGEKMQKNYKIRSNFTGRTREGNFVILPHFSGISTPVASRAL